MFFPVKMCKASIIGFRNQLPEFVKTLHEAGIVQLKEISNPHFNKESVLEEFAEVSEQLVKLQAIKKALPEIEVKKTFPPLTTKDAIQESKKLEVEQAISKIKAQKESLLAKKQLLSESEKNISSFSKFDFDFSQLSESSIVSVAAAKMSKNGFKVFEKELKENKIMFETTDKELDKENLIIIVAVEKKNEDKSRMAFDKANAIVLQLPQIKGTPIEALEETRKQISGIEKQVTELDEELLELSKKNYAFVCFLEETLQIEYERSGITSRFARTEDLFALEAYLPEKDYDKLVQALDEKFKNRFFVQKTTGHGLHKEADEVPTLLDNPPQASSLEFMTRFVSLPKSFDIDPTLVYGLIFPIVYGMMLGDVGYGLLSIVFALVLRKISAPDGLLRPISTIWAIAAIPSIIFGIFFDEYFGFSHVHLAEKFGLHIEPLYHGVERLHNIQEVLMMTIGLGFLVIAFGFILGFVKEWREGNRSHAIGKLAWVTLMVSGTAMLASIALQIDGAVGVAAIIGFLASLAVIIKTEGMMGLIEIPSVAGNILSFARILAVGLASVVVAVTLNDLAFPSLENGVVFFIISLPIFLFGHAFNAFLGMFEGLIQGSRLNYVEFYSKFYSGGGKEFSPFRVKRKFSKGR